MHTLSYRSSSWLLVPSCGICSARSLPESALSWSRSFSHHSHRSWLRPSSWSRCFTSNCSFSSTKSRRGCQATCSLNLSTGCKIPSISPWSGTVHYGWSPFGGVPFWRYSSAFFHGLFYITYFVLIPFRRLLIFVALDSHISSTGSIIDLLSLDLRLFILRWVSLFLLLNFINLMHNICPFIFDALLSHDVIVSSFDSHSTTNLWLDRPTRDSKRILSIRRECPTPCESALMILVFSLNDLFVSEVFHRILMRPTEFHFLNEIFLASNAR